MKYIEKIWENDRNISIRNNRNDLHELYIPLSRKLSRKPSSLVKSGKLRGFNKCLNEISVLFLGVPLRVIEPLTY